MNVWTWVAVGVAGSIGACVWLDDRFLRAKRRERNRERELEREINRLRQLGRDSILELVQAFPYFDWKPNPDGIPMRESEAGIRFFETLEGGGFDEDLDCINDHLTALVHAERDLGYQGRPMMMDYDFHLIAMVRSLHRR